MDNLEMEVDDWSYGTDDEVDEENLAMDSDDENVNLSESLNGIPRSQLTLRPCTETNDSSRKGSPVWEYFGELMHGHVIMAPGYFHCIPCFQDEQKLKKYEK